MSGALDLIVPDWPAPPQVRAAMTTRRGGVSARTCASLNLGFGAEDDAANVTENRRRLRGALGLPSEPRWLRQVHGARVVQLCSPSPRLRGEGRGEGQSQPPEADASFTTDAGVVCAVMAADCLPVLFCDDGGTVVAAAHAGWRGQTAGVLEATVQALPVSAARLLAWLGAAIGPASFEVGEDVRRAFVSRHADAARHFKPRHSRESGNPEKFLADLYGLARQRLTRAGVTRIYGGGADTFRERERFFSYRRDGRCGRMAALIWLGQASSISRASPPEQGR